MRFGISIPNAFTDIRQLCDIAREAEASGWDGFFLWDHINAFDGPTIDPWIALAAIATSTSRIRIGTMVTPLARRRPWVVARQAATLDHLSGGRVILGVGLGYPPDREFSDLGEDSDDKVRGEKLDESLAIIDGLWSGEAFSFSGKHYNIDNARFLPRPVQQPRIPIWVAGMWPNRAPFRRAARWDGAFPIKADLDPLSNEEVREIVAYVASRRESGGAYDVVIGSDLPRGSRQVRDEARAASRHHVAAYAAEGVTWWVEGAYDADELRSVARLGPPLGAD
jgi:alkanesulfonate monooxygenase SsuD/methylene tetrahydromethanopterin reductase-like flavin-dependent oxidoreductase (luciferase family)